MQGHSLFEGLIGSLCHCYLGRGEMIDQHHVRHSGRGEERLWEVRGG